MNSKFDSMFKFISLYKYEISKSVPDNLKCEKCKSTLINAYFIPCGCSYCCDCVNAMLNDGVKNCPGKTVDCKDELLSNKHVDLRRNKEISNVIIKCPEEMCLYECTIINMEEHVRVCETKNIECPFSDLGCDGKKISRDMMNDHCQSANFDHCKILIEMIDNMRSEIDILKANDEKNQLKIDNLEKNLKSKDEIIDKIIYEINLINDDKQNNKQEFELFKEIVENIIINIDDNFDRENKRMNIEKDEHNRECDNINRNLEKKTNEIFAEIQKVKEEQIKSIKEITMETKDKSEIMETRINKLNKFTELKIPLIEWTIDKLDERRKGGYICSKYFTGIIKQYKLQLQFYANGIGDIIGKGCSAYLCLCPGANDQFLCWPFTADVKINIISKTNPNINKSITKYCKIDKPPNNYGKFSDSFNYLFCDLTKDGEMLHNCFIVECFVDFK